MDKYEILKEYFGYSDFRKGQEDVINSILDNKDVVAIMPTGAGKSICYQIPAIMNEGITIIVSPLISLMQDQVKTLIQLGIPSAYINSSLNERQIKKALLNASQLKYKLIYVAPERLTTKDFIEFANSVNIYMVTVDEAHCISGWGQDFRPSYLNIKKFVDDLKYKPIVSAFTATATDIVLNDIIKLLDLKKPNKFITGFNRENLFFEVRNPENKLDALIEFLEDYKMQSGIIYCSTRKNVEKVYEELSQKGMSITRYHAGLSDVERKNNQEDFLYDKTQIIVATNAFGMGIDKSNVSYVVHFNMPKDMESYYQEAGRAGRDGSVAKCILFYGGRDVVTAKWLIENGSEEKTEEIKANEYKKLNDMVFYSRTNECLRNYILDYFGENPEKDCGNCSNCNTTFKIIDITNDAKQIIECIHELNEKYATTIITNVLVGKATKRILELRLDNVKSFGISNKTLDELNGIIDYLVYNEYIQKEDGQFSILKLMEKSKDIQDGSISVSMKFAEKSKTENSKSKSGKKGTIIDKVSRELEGLYVELSNLRKKIADDRQVPPFVIFSNVSLIDMCNKLPNDLDEFKNISGVGQFKLDEFGKEFIEVIANYTKENNIQPLESIEEDKKQKKYINDYTVDVSDEAVGVNVIAKRINNLILTNRRKRITGVKIGDWLLAEGYLCVKDSDDGKKDKIPTDYGIEKGIIVEERTVLSDGIQIQKYDINLYPKDLQQFIIDNIQKIIEMK